LIRRALKWSHKGIHLRSQAPRKRILLLLLCGVMGFWGLGCEMGERFKVPKHYNVRSGNNVKYSISRTERKKKKLKVPRKLPAWTEFAESTKGLLFQPEPVKLKGVRWFRDSESKLYTFYCRRNNFMKAQELAIIANQVAAFFKVWLDVKFTKRIQVVVMPEPDPRDKKTKFTKKRLAIPPVSGPRILVYSGTNLNPYFSKYGMAGELITGTLRWLLTKSTKPNPKRFWRSIALPAYFDLRGTGAMVHIVYDREARSKYMEILEKSGFPSRKELERLFTRYQKGQLEKLLHVHVKRTSSSLPAFIEDAYGHGLFALILRHLVKHPKASFPESIKAVTGRSWSLIWKQWAHHYYSYFWLKAMQQPNFQPSLLKRPSLQATPPPAR